MTRRVLVTGAAGNIGGALTERLIADPGTQVVAVDNFLTGLRSKLPHGSPANFSFVEADVNDFESIAAVMRQNKFDYVFHYAAVVGVQRTLANPVSVLKDIDGIKYVLELSRETGVKRVFYSSSSEIYGEPVHFPQNEQTTPLNSRLPYAIVKNVGEAFIRSYHKEFGLSYSIFRFFNTYGPRQSEDFVITRFLKQAINNKDITIYGDGSQTRTFCYIDDNIETSIRCLYNDKCINDVMNIGSDEEISILDLAKRVISITATSSKIKFLPALKEGDMTRRMPDLAKMRSILNRPLISVNEGISRTFKATTTG
jgi:UDP-glucose 4-epimerase